MARSTQVAKTSNGKSEASVEDLTKQIEALKSDLAGLTKTISDLGRTQGEALAESAKIKAQELKARGQENAELVARQARALNDDANQMIADRPGTALGLAVGVGILIGLMTARR
ncbi:DUF883 family protein [Oceanomicrobium pacificus]|uniref:DUF883 family protein n=1 Tax=Oceanomicrobium pacificus TaxID=2692916 RepID=A0A6B0TWM9_9RHOB|nr:DUF883 family protein [Oceanomicrobium pacificus]MXU65682.1 DUF883 family protein [Oceanomicrobium pacificus]